VTTAKATLCAWETASQRAPERTTGNPLPGRWLRAWVERFEMNSRRCAIMVKVDAGRGYTSDNALARHKRNRDIGLMAGGLGDLRRQPNAFDS
jgi:hypothetical protein